MTAMILNILSLTMNICLGVALYLHIRKDARGKSAMVVYVDSSDTGVKEYAKKLVMESRKSQLEELDKRYTELSDQINNALSEINPNFEAAKSAISQVNDLGAGLLNLFNYDPMAALKASRTERIGE